MVSPCFSAKIYNIAPKHKKKMFTTIKAAENQYIFFLHPQYWNNLSSFASYPDQDLS